MELKYNRVTIIFKYFSNSFLNLPIANTILIMDVNKKFSYSIIGFIFIFIIYAFFFLRKPDVGIRKQDFLLQDIKKIEVTETLSDNIKSFEDTSSIKKIIHQILISKEINIWNPPNGKSPFMVTINYNGGNSIQFYLTNNPDEGIWFDVKGVKYNGLNLSQTLLELTK